MPSTYQHQLLLDQPKPLLPCSEDHKLSIYDQPAPEQTSMHECIIMHAVNCTTAKVKGLQWHKLHSQQEHDERNDESNGGYEVQSLLGGTGEAVDKDSDDGEDEAIPTEGATCLAGVEAIAEGRGGEGGAHLCTGKHID